jgi:hypothetical protein
VNDLVTERSDAEEILQIDLTVQPNSLAKGSLPKRPEKGFFKS